MVKNFSPVFIISLTSSLFDDKSKLKSLGKRLLFRYELLLCLISLLPGLDWHINLNVQHLHQENI